MADSKNQQFTSVKLCVIVGSVVTSRATPLSLRTKIVHVQCPHTAREAQCNLLRDHVRVAVSTVQLPLFYLIITCCC